MSSTNMTLNHLSTSNSYIKPTYHRYFPYLVLALPLSFFTFQFILRLWPGLMMPQIIEQYGINASQFGLMAAFYYYGYALMQIPVAILYEKYGVKSTLSILALLCGVGTLVYSCTNNFSIGILSRFLVGVGSAAGWIGVTKVVSTWFPKEQFAKWIGFAFTVGISGLLFGGKPISMLVETYSWQNVAIGLAFLSMAIGLITFLVCKAPPVELHPDTTTDENLATSDNIKAPSDFSLKRLSSILSSPAIWVLALANLLMVGALEGFADIWGIQFLMLAFEVSKTEAASYTSFIFIGMLIGGPILALMEQRINTYAVLGLCGLAMACLFSVLFWVPISQPWIVMAMLGAIGVFCCYQVMVFSAGRSLVSLQQLGLTIAFLNCINMFGGSFFHTIIGYLMDFYWTGLFNTDGSKLYELSTYQMALSIIPICALTGSVLALLTKYLSKKESR